VGETFSLTPPTDSISSHLSWGIFSSTLHDADGDADDDADDADAVISFNQLGQTPLQCRIGGSLPTADVSMHQLVQQGEEGYLLSSILPSSRHWCPDT
jgi:hypothetical protein